MGIDLLDKQTEDTCFSINFWHWRAIVEEIRRQRIIPEEIVDGLHEPYCGNGLTVEQCRLVASVLREKVISKLSDSDTERILLDGNRTKVPDDYLFHKVELEKNYSTDKSTLSKFVECLETCNGFEVL
jgi:hypothetical protein